MDRLEKLNNVFLTEDDLSTLGKVEQKNHSLKVQLIKHLYLNGPDNMPGICKKLNISHPTFNYLVKSLIEEDLVHKYVSVKINRERISTSYKLKKNIFFVLVIEIELRQIKMTITDNTNTLFAQKIISSSISSGIEIVDFYFDQILNFINRTGIKWEKLLGVGICLPGYVSSQERGNFPYILTEQESQSLKVKLTHKFKKVVLIINDAEGLFLAEYWFGQAKSKNNVLLLSMDWGVGLGIILKGKLHNGPLGFAAEFGHIPLEKDGELCHCGKRGCLETVASGKAMVKQVKKRLITGQNSIIPEMVNGELDQLEPGIIIQAANQGDQFSINILSEIGINMGKGIAILIQIFNPEIIILEGKIADAKDFITTPIQQSINTYCMSKLNENTKIILSDLKENSNLLGFNVFVANSAFNDLLKNLNYRVKKSP